MLVRFRALGALLAGLTIGACSEDAGQIQLPPPVVGVQPAMSAAVSGEYKFVGTLEAVQRVELRVRVQGTIEQKYFIDGDDVKKGQKLFQIDPRSPKAALAETRANLANAQANLQKARADARRARNLYEANSISRAELDTALAQERAAIAMVGASQATVQSASLDTQFTEIFAPFDGQVGRTTVNVGNLVSPSTQTPLATVVRLDPIYVEFALGERDYLRSSRRGQGEDSPDGGLLVALQLVDGSLYEFQGRLVFISPELDPTTGTFLVRALFPNPHRVLRPGQFAKVIFRTTEKEEQTLVPDEAVVTKQAGTFAYVLGDEGLIEERKVVRGASRGSLRIIESGVNPGEKVVTQGVHKVRDGITVAAKDLPELDLTSDPLSVAPPEVYPGDWYAEFEPTLVNEPTGETPATREN